MTTTRVISRTSAIDSDYKYGFYTDIDSDFAPKGINEDIVRLISEKKDEPEWMLDWRLRAYRHWAKQENEEPTWAKVDFDPIDYGDIYYYAAPKSKDGGDAPQSLDEVDPELLETFSKLGIPLEEQKQLTGVAVDAVFDSVSVATTYQEQLKKAGVIFCSMTEAVRDHPDLVQKYLGSVVPYSDNFFATLNSAVFSDGSFVYVPPGVRCPIELMTYFRINALDTGQFERTLIVADEGSYVSYLEGCTAPLAEDAPAPCGGGGACGPGWGGDQVLHTTELVPRRQERGGRRLQLRHQAWQGVQGCQDIVDAGRDGLGDHVEVSLRLCCRETTLQGSSTRWRW